MSTYVCFIIFRLDGLQAPNPTVKEEFSPFMRIVEITQGVVTLKEIDGNDHLVLSLHIDADTIEQAGTLAQQKGTDAIAQVFVGATPEMVDIIIQTEAEVKRSVQHLPMRKSIEIILNDHVVLKEFASEYRPHDN